MIMQDKWKGGMKNWRFGANSSPYLGNSTIYGHSYNDRRNGMRKRSVDGAVSNDLE